MCPGTVHAVLTTDHCIVSGGHFYNSTLFIESARSLIKDHYYGNVTTNTEHNHVIFYFFKIVCTYVEAFDMERILDVSTKGQFFYLFIALIFFFFFRYPIKKLHKF